MKGSSRIWTMMKGWTMMLALALLATATGCQKPTADTKPTTPEKQVQAAHKQAAETETQPVVLSVPEQTTEGTQTAKVNVTGELGSPSAATAIPGNQLPAPAPKFGGVIKETVEGSVPWCPPRVVPPEGAPNVLLVLVDGIKQEPIEGVSMVYTFDKANANLPARHKTQYFEMIGERAIYHDGWFANTKVALAP